MAFTARSVLVRNVSTQGTKEELVQLFESTDDIGEIEHILSPADGVYYFVFKDPASVDVAVTNLNNVQFKTRKLDVRTVEETREPQLAGLVSLETPKGGTRAERLKAELATLSPEELADIIARMQVPARQTADPTVDQEGASGGVPAAVTTVTTTLTSSAATLARDTPTDRAVDYLTPSAQPASTNTPSTTSRSMSMSTSSTTSASTSRSSQPLMSASTTSGTSRLPQTGSSLPSNIRLSQFSGDTPGKADVTYQQWRLEVRSLLREGFRDEQVVGCIRRNVRGVAAKLLLSMTEDTTSQGILEKFDTVFGEVLLNEATLQKFYRSSQENNETIAVWACKLEEMLALCSVSAQSKEEMLRNRFFNGLADVNIQNALRHYYDNGAMYNQLLVAARRAELERKPKSAKTQQVSEQESSAVEKKMDLLLKQMKELQERVVAVEKASKNKPSGSTNSQQQPKSNRPPPWSGSRGRNSNNGGRNSNSGQHDNQWRNNQASGGSTCFNCGHPGHYSYNCNQPRNSPN